MATTTRLPNGGKIILFSREFTKAMRKKQKLMLELMVLEVADKVRELHTDSPRGGKTYRVGKTPTKADKSKGRRFRTHKASAPGEPPAVDTGRLRGGIATDIRFTLFGLEGVVGTNVDYGPMLEFGTKKIKPRPMWGRALRESRNELIKIMELVARK